MIHFLYLVGFALLASVVLGAVLDGTSKERLVYGIKIFFQFIIISLILAWIFYFIPW